ncbi:hemolysin-type calcium-binding protein [Nostoc sp. CHAB 5784]|uniref:calcium-binding protein n=1 Tax=Nostoc mirabile TaxID=2907820 RepID=UPI001E64FBD8|nr:calcium-binding protein [Nostoc mirabile]MCC5662998.1 hemolysin-type calcium-binding protein [Nostoc mirabile CHAB5784]
MSQISLQSTYSQDFNSLASSPASLAWNNDGTLAALPGWYANRSSGSQSTLSVSDGGANKGNLYSLGTTGKSDRALGSIGSGSTGNFIWGVRFVNDTGSTINDLSISYTGEQWRNSGAAPQTIDFQYQIGASNLTTGAWVDYNGLDFTSPVSGGTINKLDGNLAANKVSLTASLNNLSLAAGQEIWFRWVDIDHFNSDHALAIDDFSLSRPIFGTPGADNLVGTNFQDMINGLLGNDTITGGKGNDAITGGGGNDTFIIRRGDGSDIITDFGGAGTEINPSSSVRAEMDILKFQGEGLTAKSMILTQIGLDLQISFENVSDTSVTLKNFKLENFNNFREPVLSQPHIGNIIFDGETIVRDTFDVYAPNRTSTTNYKNDYVTFLNDLNNNYIGLVSSNDVINGLGGDDTIDGRSGDDLLRGGEGNDTLFGGDGNDILVGGIGNDYLTGGSGIDRFVLEVVSGTDTISDFTDGEDLIKLSGTLSFAQLNITQGTGVNVNDTLIRLKNNNQLLAIFSKVSYSTITAVDFTFI